MASLFIVVLKRLRMTMDDTGTRVEEIVETLRDVPSRLVQTYRETLPAAFVSAERQIPSPARSDARRARFSRKGYVETRKTQKAPQAALRAPQIGDLAGMITQAVREAKR